MQPAQACDLIDRATEARSALAQQLLAERTDAYRLLNGTSEGWPGVTIDRYGTLVLVQTFREPLGPALEEAITAHLLSRVEGVHEVVVNHRVGGGERSPTAPVVCREMGLAYQVAARHRGKDPWLYLQMRAGRRWVRAHAAGTSVLNLFAYTCAVGQCAAAGGAAATWNVDFSERHLEIGRQNLALSEVSPEGCKWIAEDVFPVVRQLAGLPVKGRGKRREYRQLAARQFDLVVLDPPPWATSAFGAVDVVRDYQSLFKPALLATAPGGRLLVTNHAAQVQTQDWVDLLERCAAKAGRPLRALDLLPPEADFPSFDDQPPQKMAIVST